MATNSTSINNMNYSQVDIDRKVMFEGRLVKHGTAALMAASKCKRGPIIGVQIINALENAGATITESEIESLNITNNMVRIALERCLEDC